MISLVLFDVGSTLVDPHPSSHDLILQVLKAHGAQLELSDLARVQPEAWQAVSKHLPFERYGQKESSEFWDLFYREILDRLNVAHDAVLRSKIQDEFQRIENWRLYPDAVAVLRELRGRGYRLGVVSNWEEWLEDLLLALDIHELFEVIVASGPFGRAKPHPSIFQQALTSVGVAADEAVHVGDNPVDDVEGARSAGVRPILIDRQGRYGKMNVERVSSLSELLTLL